MTPTPRLVFVFPLCALLALPACGKRPTPPVVTLDPALWRQETEAGEQAYERRDYAASEKHFRAALREAEKIDAEGRHTAVSLNGLGRALASQGQYADAEPLYRRALDVLENLSRPDAPSTATVLDNLANLCQAQQRYAEAEPLYRRALEVREEALGAEHTDVATSLNNLAALYYHQKRYAEAEPLYRRALGIDEKALGPDHPAVAGTLENYADLLRRTGREMEAAKLEERAQAIRAKQPAKAVK